MQSHVRTKRDRHLVPGQHVAEREGVVPIEHDRNGAVDGALVQRPTAWGVAHGLQAEHRPLAELSGQLCIVGAGPVDLLVLARPRALVAVLQQDLAQGQAAGEQSRGRAAVCMDGWPAPLLLPVVRSFRNGWVYIRRPPQRNTQRERVRARPRSFRPYAYTWLLQSTMQGPLHASLQ